MPYKKLLQILGNVFVLFLLAGADPFAVRAQETIIQPVPVKDPDPREIPGDRVPGGPAVEIDGDRIDYDLEANKVIVSGHVSVRRDKTELFCDRLEYFRDKGVGLAEGNVVLVREGTIVTGERMEIDFNTMQGDFLKTRYYSQPFYGVGDKVERISEDHYRLTNGYITTSDLDDPHWYMWARTVDIHPGEKLVARNLRFRVGDVTLFPLHKYTKDLRERQRSLAVIPGYDSNWGAFVLNRYRYIFNHNLQMKLHLDYRELRDLAWGVDFKYKMPDYGEGLLRTYYMNERFITSDRIWDVRPTPTVETERYKVEWRHKWNIDERTNFIGQYYKLSDNFILQEYFEREYDEDPSPDTFFILTRALTAGTLSLTAEPRVNRFETDVEVLPGATYTLSSLEIFDTNFYLSNTTSAEQLFLKDPSPNPNTRRTFRVHSDNELGYPTKVSFIEVRPFTGLRSTYYSDTLDKGDDDIFRGQFRTGVDLSTKFFRVFEVFTDKYGLDINRLRHVITPSATYEYAHDPTYEKSKLTQFDEVDALQKEHYIDFQLENKLQTKRNEVSVDLVRFILGTRYLLKENAGDTGFNTLTADLEITPFSWASFFFDSTYDMMDERLTTANFDFYLHDENHRWYLKFGRRYDVDVDDQLTYEVGYRINQKWRLLGYHRYDLDTGRMQEQEYRIRRDMHSWTMDLIVNSERSDSDQILIVFNLKAFPDIGFETESTTKDRAIKDN